MSERTSLRERKKEQTRRDLVRAAVELFEERGYEATSVEDIAERANYSRATFFRYFAGKEDVVFAGAPEQLASKLAALSSSEPLADPWGTVREAVTENLLETTSLLDPKVERACARLMLSDPTLRRRYAEETLRAQEEVAACFAAAWGVDADTSVECQVLAMAIIGVAHAAFRAQLYDPDGEPVADLLKKGFKLLEHSLVRNRTAPTFQGDGGSSLKTDPQSYAV